MKMMTDVMERMLQLWVPGVEKFYEKFPVDPWQKADDDLAEVLVCGNENASTHALVGYEAKKRRLIDLYKQFLDLQDKQVQRVHEHDVVPAYRIYLLRDNVLCDCCKKSVSESKYMTMSFYVREDSFGDLQKIITTTCAACASSREAA